MYMQMGLTDSEVGLYTGWLALPWVIKPLWSPFIDLLKTKRWWVLTMQALIGAALAGIAFSIPTAFWFQATMCFFFLIAFCSATHDISADGFSQSELHEEGAEHILQFVSHFTHRSVRLHILLRTWHESAMIEP